MPDVTRHEPGDFSWAELATSDPAAAKTFYKSLFGWSAMDTPMGPGSEDVYSTLQLGGKAIGALYKMRPDQASQGVPPHWLTYVTVASADESAKKARSLGGKVLAEPFDVMTFGRMAVLQDPVGATFAIWQARDHIGAQRVNEPGAFCWMELMTPDAARAKAFYKGLFGWGLKESTDGMPYTEIQLAGRSIGGIFTPPPEMGKMPPAWGVYWQVDDCDATAKKAKSTGATLAVEPKDIPHVGRFAVIADPQGAMFSIIKLARA